MPAHSDSHTDPDATLLASGSVGSGTRLVPDDLPSAEVLEGWLRHRQYSVQGFIGRGGMGAVYRGMQVALQRAVAIKIMRRRQGGDAGFEQRFHREALALAKLSHPGIVSVIDYGEAGPDYLFLVMEFVDGTDLMEIIRSRDVTQEMALALLPQICDALQFAHDQGIVHRDVKPSNILLTRDGRIKIADFGLAKHLDVAAGQQTGAGVRLGTPDYAAPEQLEPGTEVDHRADIYALGVMIYQMLTGQLPRGSWRPPSERADVAADWDRIVSRAMKPEPQDRYDRASEVKSDITRISTHEPAKATATRRKTLGWKAWLGMTALVLVALWVWWEFTPPIRSLEQTVPASVTQDHPLVNSLGMKFVPVPGTTVLMCIHETRRQDYAAFAKETSGVSVGWQNPVWKGQPVTADNDCPVVNVSPNEARLFCAWLSKREGRRYRLPTDLEWSYAVGIGDKEDKNATPEQRMSATQAFPWSGQKEGNYLDVTAISLFGTIGGAGAVRGYEDGFATTAPVMRYHPNRLGLYDLGGNVSEICSDWKNTAHTELVTRGGNWQNFGEGYLMSGCRLIGIAPEAGDVQVGFRCVMEDEATDTRDIAAVVSDSSNATRDHPFINTLGMKFVPVPGSTVLMCIHETRRQDYAAYADQKRGVDERWQNQMVEGVPVGQGNDHPVVHVSWFEAQRFCEWLSQKEGRHYRLPTDAEWSDAVGIGEQESAITGASPQRLSENLHDVFPWGGKYPPRTASKAGNYRDLQFHEKFPDEKGFIDGFDDGYPTTAPVMSYPANELGIFDLGGNVPEWCDTWYNADEVERVIRGAGWFNINSPWLCSSFRFHAPPDNHYDHQYGFGFRCVVEAKNDIASAPPKPVATPTTPEPGAAAKDKPFANTLGMKFVPVPHTKTLMCMHETRRQDYAVYAAEVAGVDGSWKVPQLMGKPLTQGVDHPVVQVSWDDAVAFCAWLSKKEHRLYRLPTEDEWNLAVVTGIEEPQYLPPAGLANALRSMFPWGTADWKAGFKYGKYDFKDKWGESTAPVMSYLPNDLGIYDLGGNAWEWCDGWYDDTQKQHPMRGCGCRNSGDFTASGTRNGGESTFRIAPPDDYTHRLVGFRCVLEVGEVIASPDPVKPAKPMPLVPPLTDVTKDKPFINSLGMKFVPVPITGGPTDGQRVLFCIWETRTQDYETFTKKTYYPWRRDLDGFDSGPMQPAVHVTWKDADEFCKWLTRADQQAGKLAVGDVYRLPTDHEWSCAVGLGSVEDPLLWPSQKDRRFDGVYPWGKAWPPPAQAGNLAGEELLPVLAAGKFSYVGKVIAGYHDDFTVTAPVGSFPADQNGLHDLCGNVGEWVDDWWDTDQKQRTVRGGGAWLISNRGLLSSAHRASFRASESFNGLGFRCVLVSARTGASGPKHAPEGALTSATKDQPFANSLGMKFVPVLGTKVLMCIHETRRQDYAAYAAEVAGVERFWTRDISLGERTGAHPVTGLDWGHAEAFCAWLSKKDGIKHRLPTDQEWSFAVGIGDRETWSKDTTLESLNGKVHNAYPWGTQWPPPPGAGNYGDLRYQQKYPSEHGIEGYDDGFATAAPVMSFQPNRLGIYDLGGNAKEMCTGWTDPQQSVHVLRGAAWNNSAGQSTVRLESSWREADSPHNWTFDKGFRCVIELPAEAAASPIVASSTNDPATVTLFDGKTLNGWKIVGDPSAFSIDDSAIKTSPKSSTLLYVGTGSTAPEWTDFEFSATIKTGDRANSGVWFHTPPDGSFLPANGYVHKGMEVQVTRPNGDSVMTGGLYYCRPIKEIYHQGEWFTLRFTVIGDTYICYIRDKKVNEWTQPKDWVAPVQAPEARFGKGTFAIPSWKGEVWFKDIRVRNVAPAAKTSASVPSAATLSDPLVTAASDLAQATKDKPFTNSLDMKFVPVPGTDVLMCIHETRRQDYAAYAAENPGINGGWKTVTFDGAPCGHMPDHPVAGVNCEEGEAFCAWLSTREGITYRLPTDKEWSYAVGIGEQEDWSPQATPRTRHQQVKGAFPWEGGYPPKTEDRAGNYADASWLKFKPDWNFFHDYNDGFITTAPVMSFKPNKLGLYDLGGNVWESVSDWSSETKAEHVLRGGSFDNANLGYPMSSFRGFAALGSHRNCHGFRCVIAIEASESIPNALRSAKP